MPKSKSVGKVVAAQVRAIRERRGWSQRQLAERLADLGVRNLGRDAVAKIETGRRRVTVEEVLALAAALQVAPVHLMIPYERDAQVEITPKNRVTATRARHWVHGWQTLVDGDEQVYFSEMPRDEWWVHRNSHVRRLARLFETVALAAETNPAEAQDLYDRLAGDVERFTRSRSSEVMELLPAEDST